MRDGQAKVLKTSIKNKERYLGTLRITYSEEKVIALKKYADLVEKTEISFTEQLKADIISIDEVREKRERMNKKLEKLVLEIHPYSIKQMNGKDARWFTTVKKEGCDRKIVKKNTYEELIQYLVDYYALKEVKKKITLRTMYPIWRAFKESCTKKTSTIRRIEADWKRFYLNDPIIDKPLKDMSKNDITGWINHKILKDGIRDSKTFYNMLTIFKNVFEYCYSEELIESNTFEKATYRKELLHSYSKPLDETQVFTKEEVASIVEQAFKEFHSRPKTTTYLAIPLLFQTGLRCGELVALETTDYDRERKILHITKSEGRSYTKTEDGTLQFVGAIVDEPKKEASKREIPLTDEACRILDMIIHANEENKQSAGNYIFVYNHRRVQTASVLKKIYRLCDGLGIDKRSTHKIRKTTLSTMLDTCIKNDIADISAVRYFAGHSDESTLLKNYIFSTRKEETRELATKALNFGDWKHLETKSPEERKVGSL